MGTLRQKSTAGKTTNSLVNYLMGNNATLPEIGKGATVLSWTDREAYEVIWVSENKRECKIQRYNPERSDSNGMSESQSYKYETLTGEILHLVWRQGAWRVKNTKIEYTKEYIKSHMENQYSLSKTLSPELEKEIYQGRPYPQRVVKGITKEKATYNKINIIFGVKKEYYDYSF